MIHTELNSGILAVTFNRPQECNSFNCDMFRRLRDRLKSAERNPDIRVIVVTGEGEHFSLGQDLNDMSHSILNNRHPAITFMREFAAFPKPIIANVHGNAFGLGMALLLHCDLVVADPNSRFQLPFSHQELVPLFASSMLLPQRIGPQRSTALLLLGEEFTAEQGYQWGLINQVAPQQQRDEIVARWGEQLCNIPERVIHQTKQLLHRSATRHSEEVMADEWHLFSEYMREPSVHA
ncbi:enoyl-CoA hydratase/isomerase family protein [Celerinatantimonas sp. YJH-8]|uniref:enoyl-CoA hydratase/isomerase family protein n=1 Tax=Celerinatantimonas sp. YJH-8 TaxID=3228714 RepID=UPI0038C0FF9C